MELMVVVVIIVILAGITIASMKYINAKTSMEKAKVQMKLLEGALEEYKLDTGNYPDHGSNPNSGTLFTFLYWDTDNDGQDITNDTDQKIYLNELDPNSNKQGWVTQSGVSYIIVDPWASEWQYRRGGLPATGANNPDYDLWSKGPDGKSHPSDSHNDNKDNIKNW